MRLEEEEVVVVVVLVVRQHSSCHESEMPNIITAASRNTFQGQRQTYQCVITGYSINIE